MNITRRRGAIAFFITLCVCLVGLAVALNVGWILINGRRAALLSLGVFFFLLLIAGVILNTIFLIREIRRNERQDSFLNAVTHELKTPIASIRLYLETLQRRSVDEKQRQDFYRIMLSDSDRLLATVEQVLKAGELGHRHREQHRTRVDMAALVADCIAITLERYHLAEPAIRMEDIFGARKLFVLGNAEDLRTAVLNLLDNAVKYSPSNVHIRAKLSIARNSWVLIRITDQGVGIPGSHLKKVFHRFYRVPGRDAVKVKGTGLGLFIVRSIAQQHGGDATAQSSGVGHGSTFTLQLPYAPPSKPTGEAIYSSGNGIG